VVILINAVHSNRTRIVGQGNWVTDHGRGPSIGK
jgi:hypothetical protein